MSAIGSVLKLENITNITDSARNHRSNQLYHDTVETYCKYRIFLLYFQDVVLFFVISFIRLSEKFLSFYEEIIDTQRYLFYIILSNYLRSILFR